MNVYEYLILKRQMMYKHYIFETNDNGGVMVIILASSTVDRRFIGGVMVIVLASSTVDRRFKHQADQTKDYKISMCCSHAHN